MNIDRKKLAIAAGVVVSLAVIAYVIVGALRQPSVADFRQLDTERQIVDASMNIYSPLFSDYSGGYGNAYAEQRSDEEKAELKEQFIDSLEQERRVNAERLNTMGSSVALRQPEVKQAFDAFDVKYSAIVDYYDQHTKNIAAITESVSGRCAQLSKLNVAVSTYSSDYIKTADACLEALSSAKETSDGTTKKLLESVEKLIKERRDKFKETTGKEGFELNIAKIQALISLLDINADVKVIQDEYESTTKQQYTKLVNDANVSNDELKKVLESRIGTSDKKGSE